MSVVKWLLFLVVIPSNALLSQVRDTTLTVYFSTDVFELDSFQTKQIKEFAAVVSGITKVTGYADSIGTVEYNYNLSMERAKSVAHILKQDLSDKLIDYKGETFVRSNELSKNRVVEINGYVSESLIIDIFDIEYILFVPDKPIITPESLPNVQRLVKRLKGYKFSCFELIGHVNYESRRPSSVLKSMFKLSEQRACVIKDLLVENGIPANRIQSRGVGNSQPIYADPVNDEERKKNMRVQVIVYSCIPKNQ
jgi:outer membrane protein OmpA-like peptidoglycan-associated protein